MEIVSAIMGIFKKKADDFTRPLDSLEEGNNLCSSRSAPMDSELIQKVEKIYKECRASLDNDSTRTPLLLASLSGLDKIVWGFIECAKETNTNLQTGNVGEFQEFLSHTNALGESAIDVAVNMDEVDVVKVLLAYASPKQLMSYTHSILHDPMYDEVIFEALEAAAIREKVEVDAPTLISIDDEQQESIRYVECMMVPSSYPRSHTNNTHRSLKLLDLGKLELSPNKNTILHLVAEFGDVKYVRDILEKHPSLVLYRNFEGETPAYVAAREGHVDIVEMMINHFKTKQFDIESLLTRNMDKDTALHAAIQNHHVGVVFWLIKNVPGLANYINDFEESPLYLAAEKRYFAILKLMLDKCKENSFAGPNGSTALHAATSSQSLECIGYLLSTKPDLLYAQDKHGRTPLHYAAHHGLLLATTMLLDKDQSIGYQTRDDMHAIHIAASRGYREMMEILISKCPGCQEITNSKRRNILHVAIENKQTEVIKFIFRNKSLTGLINRKDSDGNTPIHLLMASDL